MLIIQAKKGYESACKELEQIDVKVNTAKNSAVNTMGTKEFEKVCININDHICLLN